jgi:8-oxo-dGTP diphosphatase
MPKYAQTDVSVDCVVFGYNDDGLRVLLIEQGFESGQYAVPGDLIFEDECLITAAGRVLFELTSLKNVFLKQFRAFGDPNRVNAEKDQEFLKTFRDYPDRRVVTVAYYALVSLQDHTPEAASFAGQAKWISIDEVPELAFDHNEILNCAIETLRDQIESHHISFELLPRKFTLSQLQSLYEIVLRKKLDKRNFRKNVKKRMPHVVPLDEKQTGVLHKPAQLFQFDPKKGSE